MMMHEQHRDKLIDLLIDLGGSIVLRMHHHYVIVYFTEYRYSITGITSTGIVGITGITGSTGVTGIMGITCITLVSWVSQVSLVSQILLGYHRYLSIKVPNH